MKKIAILGIMFFINFFQVFAGENSGKLENVSFSWQLNHQENNQKINFINLNPMFFADNNHLFITFYEGIGKNSNYQNNRNTNTFSGNNNLDEFSTVLIWGLAMTTWFVGVNQPGGGVRNDTWRQQKEAEDIYRKFSPDASRNFYQGIYP